MSETILFAAKNLMTVATYQHRTIQPNSK